MNAPESYQKPNGGSRSLKRMVRPRFGYGKSSNGLVHLVSALSGEFTLCGDAFDGGDTCDGADWTEHKRGPVTCPLCIEEIVNCRGVRVRPNK